MGFIKNICSVTGFMAGKVVSIPTRIVAEVTNSDSLRGISHDIVNVTHNSGKIIGDVVSGAADVAAGTITLNKSQIKYGLNDVGGAGKKVAKGVAKGTLNTLHDGKNLVQGALERDGEKVLKSSGRLARTAIISTMAIGIADEFSGGIIEDDDTDTTTSLTTDQDHSNNEIKTTVTDLKGSGVAETSIAAVDIDGDEFSDIAGVAVDINGDGVPDAGVGLGALDSDGDGISETGIVTVDVDGDGVIDGAGFAIDTNGDGVPNIAAGVSDVDGDGIADASVGIATADVNGDGIDDIAYACHSRQMMTQNI